MANSRDAALIPTLEDFRPDSLRGTPGFFRVAQARSGHWWLVDPAGHAFFSKGVAGVNRSGRMGGRLPQPGPYAMVTTAKFNAAEGHSFLRAAIQRLRGWQFNTLGAWTEAELSDQGMYYTEALSLGRCGPVIHSAGAWLPDVFDPAWREAAEAQARELCAPHRGSRELIGYFTDSGLNWAQPQAELVAASAGRTSAPYVVVDAEPERPSLLQICLSLEPAHRAYHAAWEFVLATRRGDLGTLARDWAVELPNKETLRQLTQAEQPLTSAGYLRDQRLFAREFARRYYATCAAVIRAHDPDHLILGCRFETLPGEVVLAECVYPNVDVLSAQPRGENWEKTAQACQGVRAMPVLLVEANWTGEAFTRPSAKREPRGSTSVERMLKRGRAALERICAHRAVVGYEWSAWADAEGDEPPFGRGLVHLDDREAREHTELLTEMNNRAERVRGRQKVEGGR